MNFMQPNGTFGPRVIVPVDWPPMRERVRECLLLGFSSAQIAKALTTEFEIRVTRNMVIGQIRRHPLGELARRNKWGDVLDQNMPRKPPAPRKRIRKSRAKPKIVIEIPQVEIDDQQIPIEQRCTLIQLNEHTCRWPIGDPVEARAEFFFCGGTTIEGEPYCEGHCRRAFNYEAKNGRFGSRGAARSRSPDSVTVPLRRTG